MPQPSLVSRTAAFERFTTARHLPGLDGLRGLAILPVIWHHATPRPLPGLLGKGAVGVDLFFALSGFLITTLLLRERRTRGTIALGAFFARRALRIFPLYYLVLAGYVALALLQPRASAPARHFLASLPYHASYTANWFVDFKVPHDVMFAFSWSLCVEEQYYWLWPLLVLCVKSRVLLACALLAALGCDGLLESGIIGGSGVAPGSTSWRILTSFAAPIGCGSLLALALDTRRGFDATYRVLGWRGAAPLCLLLVIGLLALPHTPYLALSTALACLVASAALRPDGGLAWLLERPALRWVGAVSYGAYLLHVTALGLVRRALPSLREEAWIVFGAGLPLSLLLAHGAFVLVERPLLRWRSRYR